MSRTYTKFIPLVKNTGINPDDISRETYSKGNRTELKLDPEQLAKIEIFRELGIKYSWSDDDFITDKKYWRNDNRIKYLQTNIQQTRKLWR